MPSHLDPNLSDTFPEGITRVNVLGNDFADKEAGSAAGTFRVPLAVATEYMYYTHLISRIQKRLVAIIMSLPNRAKPKPAPKKAKDPGPCLEEMLALSSHICAQESGSELGARGAVAPLAPQTPTSRTGLSPVALRLGHQ